MTTIYVLRRNETPIAAFVNVEVGAMVAEDLFVPKSPSGEKTYYLISGNEIPLITTPQEAIAFREAEKKNR